MGNDETASTRMKTVESELLRELVGGGSAESSPVFILGAPRTGSTILYQTICRIFDLPYIANLTNDLFAEMPIIGLCIQKSMPVEIEFCSRYGKTIGSLQPSEGSAVMTRWFGGGHPSEIVSNRILPGEEPHFLATLAAAEALFNAPLVIKNAWHCFRIPYLARALPKAIFVWVRRDVVAAAKSDLAARYATKGSATEWNSATPACLEKLRGLTPAAQVVENQHAFNSSIEQALQEHAKGRWQVAWYEDFCRDVFRVLSDLDRLLQRPSVKESVSVPIEKVHQWDLPADDERAIEQYVSENTRRFSTDRHPISA